MPRERTQLNINIDPELLLRIKSEAIKNGMTLTEFVTRKLANIESRPDNDLLEKRLAKIDRHLNLNENSSDQERTIGSIFSDDGAKNYGEVARRLFDVFLKKKGLSKEDGWEQLAV